MKIRFDTDTFNWIREWGMSAVPGATFRQNHCGCPAGLDVKRRLYLKLTEDGTMALAKCHHCGASAGIRVRAFKTTKYTTIAEPDTHRGALFNSAESLLKSCTHISKIPVVELPPALARWADFPNVCGEYIEFVNHESCRVYRSPSKETFLIAVVNDAGIPVRIDARSYKLVVGGEKNKWTRYIADDTDSREVSTIVYNMHNSNTAVLCEDQLSAMKLSWSGFAGVALSGVNLSDDTLFKVSMLYDNIVVWLDNDSKLVRDKATMMHARLQAVSDRAAFVGASEEAKNLTTPAVKARVTQAIGAIKRD